MTSSPGTGVAGDAGEPIGVLCRLLDTGDEADRCYAARALGVLGRREAIPALVARLTDPDVDVCVDAAMALARIGGAAAVEPLLLSLQNDPDGDVKTAVVDALACLGGEAAAPALLEVARHRPADMAFDDTSDWDAWWDMQLAAVRGLGQLRCAGATEVLEHLLGDDEGQDIEAEILASLARLGSAGEAVLTRRLESASGRTRRRAVRALGRAASRESVVAIGKALLDAEPEVRAAALEALAERGARAYLPPMLTFYRDPDPRVRECALRATTRLADTTAGAAPDQDALRALIGDRDPRVRALALRGLDVAGGALDDALLDAVRGALADPAAAVSAAACAVLARVDDPSTLTDLAALASDAERDHDARRAALAALGARGAWTAPVTAALTAVVADAGSPLRVAALTTLADLHRAGAGGPGAEPGDAPPAPLDILLAAVRGELDPPGDPDEPGEPAEEPADRAGAEPAGAAEPADPAPAVGASIPVEVGGPGEAIRPAKSSLEAINMDNAEVALALAEQAADDGAAAIELDEADREYLALTEANETVARWLFARDTLETALDLRRLAARVLSALDDERVGAALVAALDDDDVLAREAAGSLAEIAGRAACPAALAPAFDRLVARLGAEDRDLRIACIRTLARLGRPDALPAIEPALADAVPAVRMQTAHALGDLARAAGDRADAAFAGAIAGRLTAALADDDPGVRVAAAGALVEVLRSADEATVRGAVDALVEAAFRGTGDQARDMGRALRALAPAAATAHLVALLDRLPTSAERRVAIEMLEEIHHPGTAPAPPRGLDPEDSSSPTGEITA